MAQILTWRALIEIVLLSLVIYSVLSFLRGSRGAGVLRGLGVVLVAIIVVSLTLAETLQLHVLSWLVGNVVGYLVLALVVIFQPELRSGLVRVGQSPVFTRLVRGRWNVSDEITKALMMLAAERTGALIAIERSVGLKGLTEAGTRLDAEVSAPLLVTIFRRVTPLHDGAVIIKGNRIVAAACLFPLTENTDLDPVLGTRHRAAIGVTEETDAIAIVVSEETGDISIAQSGGLMRRVDEVTLRNLLQTVATEQGFQAEPVKGVA